MRWLVPWIVCLAVAAVSPAAESRFATPAPRMLYGGLALPDEAFLEFAERIQPDFVVLGAFGAPQWAAAEDPRAWLDQWRTVFDRLHRRGIKVVGTFELLNVGNTPAEAQRFFEFYRDRWDENLLGKKPAADPADLLEQRRIPAEDQTGHMAPRGCAVNPHWRRVAAALVQATVRAGIDGFITHRNMYGQCGCPHCLADHDSAPHAHRGRTGPSDPRRGQPRLDPACEHCSGGLRHWLAQRYDADTLRQRLGIDDLKNHRFPPITSHHLHHDRLPTPLELEAMRFARHAIKEAYDHIFQSARRRRPELILAQWNHMPYFDELHLDRGHLPPFHLTTFAHASADERWSLPIDLWGRGEDFFWYCNWGTTQNTQLDKHYLADATLYARLLRSLARGRPYVVNKYDFYRPRNMLAEAAGLAMLPGAIEVPFRHPEDAQIMARWYDFFRRHRSIYAQQNGRPVSEVLLVFPRTATHSGDAAGLEMVELAGRTMLREHVPFDLATDDLLADWPLEPYRLVIAARPDGWKADRLAPWQAAGGRLLAVPGEAPAQKDPRWAALGAVVIGRLQPHTAGTVQAQPLRQAILESLGEHRFTCDAPYTVQPHVYRQPDATVVHLVNYNHREGAPGESRCQREAPIAAPPITLRLPWTGPMPRRATFLDPDAPASPELPLRREGPFLVLQTPPFLVYGVCVIETP